ncbi:DUF4188 domain-containing protein [Fodinicola acaciae]|uniref:DUF4188 domain-containing protein n=1 Tax=Fodinicola acaciae TaxID=2681555 RepID=UPI0013D78C48|nr:DUF4188 domain-containing protein [Fodinicola acaciae]
MKTTDFSRAPEKAQATAMFIGATRYNGPLALIGLSRIWFRLLRDLKRMRGYVWHTVYWEFPFTLGTIALFEDRDAMLLFARSKHHRALMPWISDGTKRATGGWIRFYSAAESGYSQGVWRAEDGLMAHIDTFTPRSHETTGPKVVR